LTPSLRRAKNLREPKETIPPRTLDEAKEDEYIRLLVLHQRQLLEEDPIRELD
jgi:hypothetical protein